MTVLAAVSRAMIAAGGGAIVNIASMAGVSGAPNMPAYSASKAAVIGLTKAAAKDLAPRGHPGERASRRRSSGPAACGTPRSRCRRPPAVSTTRADPDAVAAQMIGMVPLRRYGSAHEVATVVAFLLSADASYVTGVNIEVSGGSV